MKPINRVQILINHYHLSISGFEKKVGLSNNSIQTAIKRNSNLKDDTLNTILDCFTDVNAEWLLTGRGEMLKSTKSTEASLNEEENNELRRKLKDSKGKRKEKLT